jgi:tetratricopeptide (TPR) repeat protein
MREGAFMGKRILITVICVLALGHVSGKDSSDKGASTEHKPSAKDVALERAIKEIINLKPPKPRPGVLVCPFTDSAGTITADSLALYFPTLYKISYCPGMLVNTPFEGYVLKSAHQWGYLNPGTKFTEEDQKILLRIFGCQEYVTGTVERGNQAIRVTIRIHREGGRKIEKTANIPPGDFHKLPTQIASTVLEEITGKALPKENKAYLDIPAAKSVEILQEAGLMTLQSYNDPGKRKWSDYADLMDKDPDMDWFVPVYLNAQTLDDSILAIAGEYAGKWKDRPRFVLLYAGFLNVMGQNDRAILRVAEAIKKMPDSTKAYEVMGWAMQGASETCEAAPFFERMLSLSPDDAWCLYARGSHRIDLAWHNRGSGRASSVSEEARKEFHKFLEEAKALLERGAERDPKNFRAWSELIRVGMGMGMPKTQVKGYFDKAVAINPNDRQTYLKMQEALWPKWGGSIPELQAFWNEMLSRDCKNHYVFTIIPYGCYEIASEYAYDSQKNAVDHKKQMEFLSSPYIWPWIERAYEKFFFGGFEDYEQRGVYGFMASMLGKYELGYGQFELSNMRFTGEAWFPYNDMLRHYCYCALRTGHYEKTREIAQKGIAYNHCPSCNKMFQDYNDRAEKKMKK